MRLRRRARAFMALRLARLRQATLRRTEGRPRLSLALHPPRGDLQLPADRARRGGRHLQMEGLPDQRPRPDQGHDARRRRVHPPLSPARPAERLPPHPPLRPHRRHGSSPQHRARPPIARRARALVSRSGLGHRRTFASAPLPLLRRPDDHRRNLRRRAPCALAIADPDQDRHLMTVASLPPAQRRSPSPPTARWSRNAMSSKRPQTLSKRRAHTRRPHPRPPKSSSSAFPPPRTMRATSPRNPTSAPSATPKSP